MAIGTEDTIDTSLAALISQGTEDLAELADRLEARKSDPPATVDTQPPRLSTNMLSAPVRASDGSLRALSSAAVGPLTATALERRRGDELARRAQNMATQALMPAISEASLDTDEEQIARLADELAGLLRDEAAGAKDPARSFMAMATLEGIRPGIMVELSEEQGGGLGTVLSPEEIEAIRAARALVAGLIDDESQATDPNELANLLERVSEQIRPHTAVRLTDVQLCRKVIGFGQYTVFASNSFIAGRPIRMILYTELDRFAHRPVIARDEPGEGERWAIEVTQELSLFVDRGRSPVWHRPEQRVVQTSRRKLRDLFLVHDIVLPSNLGTGSYQMRVRVRDLTSGSVDERYIPIRLVADATSARVAS